MPTFRADPRELVKSFRHTVEASRALQASGVDAVMPAARMLSFYAVECGLKSILCRESAASQLIMSHDLSEIIKELRIDPFGWPSAFRIRREVQTHPSKYSHLAWRYGVRISSGCEQRLELGLSKLIDYIESRI